MSFIHNKNDLILLAKAYLISILIILGLFFFSVFIFTNLKTQEVIVQEIKVDTDPFSQFLKKENISSSISGNNSSYVIYANTDPVILKIEIFLSTNKNKLTPAELKKVEQFRSDRITYLMAKKYHEITKQ